MKHSSFEILFGKNHRPQLHQQNVLSYVSRIFVERELKSLKRRKTAGCDDLPRGILKDTGYSL